MGNTTDNSGEQLTNLPEGKGVVITNKAKHKGGRPSLYSQELADEICSRLSYGESLRKITRDDDMPEGRTVWKWLRIHDEFVQQYARAKEEAADALSDDIQNIADKTLRGEYDPQASRVAIDAYKWTASKLKPKKYADKIDIDNRSEVTHRFQTLDDEKLDEAIKRAALDAHIVPNNTISDIKPSQE